MSRASTHGAIHLCALLAVLAGTCVPSLAGRVAEDSAGPAVKVSRYIPLAPWMAGDRDSQELPACVVLKGASWGVGSTITILMWTVARMRQQRPDIMVYYDHTPSPYRCSADGSITSVLRPAGNIIQTGRPPKGCVTLGFREFLKPTQSFMAQEMGGFISETTGRYETPITSFHQGLQRHLMLDAMWEALCPVMDDWWHLTPELQARADSMKARLQDRQRPVIAIHARGGDKAVELGKYKDPLTRQYPMAEGMRRLAATHPGIYGSLPTCIIFSDDHKYAESVRIMAEDILNCGKIINRAPKQQDASYKFKDFKQEPLQERCQSTKDYLEDIELMGWSNFMIANHRANADTIATFLRKCKFHHDYSTVIPGTGAPRFTLWSRK